MNNPQEALPEKLPIVKIGKLPSESETQYQAYLVAMEVQRDADEILYTAALTELKTAQKYDLRKLIPEGKYCRSCVFVFHGEDDVVCDLLNAGLKDEACVPKHKDCPKGARC